jgi:hypothetical protein
LAACSSATAPTATESLSTSGVERLAAPSVSQPAVLVNGAPIQGNLRGGTNDATVFRVAVKAPGGLSTVRQVTMVYSQPGANHQGNECHDHGCGRSAYTGTVYCHDDGTHGDDVPGDGIYHYVDPDDRIGCDGRHAHAGEYTYSFYCEDIHGRRSSTVSVTVTRR